MKTSRCLLAAAEPAANSSSCCARSHRRVAGQLDHPGSCFPGPLARLGCPTTPPSPPWLGWAEPLRPCHCFPRHGTAIIFWLLWLCTNTSMGRHGGSEVATDGFGGSRSPRRCLGGGCGPQKQVAWGCGSIQEDTRCCSLCIAAWKWLSQPIR